MIVTSGGYVKRAAAQNRSMRKKVKILSNDDFSEILHFLLCLYITYDFRTKLTPFALDQDLQFSSSKLISLITLALKNLIDFDIDFKEHTTIKTNNPSLGFWSP